MTTFGKRLEARRTELGMTQEKLASKSGVTRVGISKIELDITKNARADTLFSLAKALKCNAKWLLDGSGDKFNETKYEYSNIIAGPKIHQFVPLIKWVQAGNWTEVIKQPDSLELYPCPIKCSPGTFALKVKGNSMLPRFEEDDLIFVDPTKIDGINGKFVLAMINDSHEPTFKQVEVIDNKEFLKALNPEYPPEIRFMKINGNCRIIGTVISHVKPV
ncbi:phage repressor protein [Photobacterium kishitanii]|uniref:LexA family protein n=1 Tax=Photobacterium kishitanii TaxID=318456 RepID=UPI000D15433E|nr:S24 family peptidase [Photobacterium kishitanii]PSU83343.1 phage repressor protein [Photobacterium kishitanii]